MLYPAGQLRSQTLKSWVENFSVRLNAYTAFQSCPNIAMNSSCYYKYGSWGICDRIERSMRMIKPISLAQVLPKTDLKKPLSSISLNSKIHLKYPIEVSKITSCQARTMSKSFQIQLRIGDQSLPYCSQLKDKYPGPIASHWEIQKRLT